MNASEILYDVGEVLGSTGNVKTVFGEPIHTEGKTVVPVAKIAYGFGGGFGEGRHPHHEASDKPGENTRPDGPQGEGGGGGGGMRVFPAGALEITTTGTRFIPFHDVRWLIGAFAAGAALGGLFARRK